MFKNLNKIDFFEKVFIKKTNRSKTISISIRNNNIVVLSPRWISNEYIYSLLEKKRKWIINKLNCSIQAPKKKKNKLRCGDKIFIFGNEKTLLFKKSKLKKIIEYDSNIEVSCFNEEDCKKKLEKWLRTEIHVYLQNRLNFFSKLMKVDFKEFYVREFKRRLGSCSFQGRLGFNWKIIFMPYKVIDYIIIHELCHLIHFNHSKDFWSQVRTYCPEYLEYKSWIKKNENRINW